MGIDFIIFLGSIVINKAIDNITQSPEAETLLGKNNMRFNILCDSDWEAKIEKVLDVLSELEYRRFFEMREYGVSIEAITIILMCQDSRFNLKQRKRYSKIEKKIYLDIMLDLNLFKQLDQHQRNRIIADKIVNETPQILLKYNLPEFQFNKFVKDLTKVFTQIK